jgi:hypothetical protein
MSDNKNPFGSMKSEGLEESQDRLGGFAPIDTKIYTGTVKALFAGQSASGAHNLSLVLDLGGGKEYKETIYISNKKGENFFKDKDSGKKMPLPGFTLVNDICLITMEKELSEVDVEEKVVKIYDFEQKKELPTSVKMITEAIGKQISVGILRVLENKNEKNADGVYVATAETKEINRIDKVFHPTAKVTVAEARSGKATGEFWDAWSKKNDGVTRDEREIKDGSGGSKTPPKAGATSGGTAAPKKSLFSK